MKLVNYTLLVFALLFSVSGFAQMEIRVGVPNFFPSVDISERHNFDIGTEVLKMVAFDEGWSLQFISCRPQKCLHLLKNGTIDVVSVANRTLERDKVFDFSKSPIYTDWPLIVSLDRNGDKLKTISELEEKKIAIIPNSDMGIHLKKSFSDFSFPVNFLEYTAYDKMVIALNHGTADYLVVSRMVRPYLESFGHKYSIIDLVANPLSLHFAVLKGNNHFILDRLELAQTRYRKMKESEFKSLLVDQYDQYLFYEKKEDHYEIILLLALFVAVLVILSYVFFSRWKQMEKKVGHMKKMVVGARKVKSDFLANMSHEVRTPLNAIMGMTEVLLDSPLSLNQKRHLEMIKGGSENLLIILNDILDLSRIESGNIQINRYQGDVRKLCNDVTNMVAIRFSGRDIGFTLDIDNNVPKEIVTDHVRLRHILANLLSNAGKFTESGDVLMKVAPFKNDHLIFEVIDTGKGMSPEVQKQIFVEFWQEDFSSSKKYGGTGLGLSITKQLVKLLDGTITVNSVEGKGSCFAVALPVGELGSFSVHEFSDADIRGQKVAIITSKQLEGEFISNFFSSKDCKVEMFHEIETGLMGKLDNLDLIFIESISIYANNRFNEVIIKKLESVLSKVVIIFPLGADSALIRDFASHHFLRYIVRPLSKFDISNGVLSSSSKPSVRCKKILIIDDEPDFRFMLEDSIGAHFDLDIVSVGSGQEGLAALKEGGLDLVILDIQMREMSGIDFFNTMKKLDFDIPVLFLSGHYLDENMLKNLDGAFMYIDKVDGVTEVLKAIEKLFELSETPDSAEKENSLQHSKDKLVLVVDDSPVNIALIEVMLKNNNYKIISGTNGKEAFELYLEKKPDIILMDLQMPEVDGYQAMENIREYERENNIVVNVPILAISAYALENEIAKAFQAGCTEYLSKPIKKKQLFMMMDELLNKGP